jgi:hypothetical protein
MMCRYEATGDGDNGKTKYKCTECGHERQSNYPANMLHRRCGVSPVAMPSTARKVFTFTIAVIAHAARGNPTCTQEQIDQRLGICRACGDFTGRACRHCGCNCGSGRRYLNKLAWADQHCPSDKWNDNP